MEIKAQQAGRQQGSGVMHAHLSELLKVQLQGLHIILKAQRAHRPQQVIPIDRLAFFSLALVTCSVVSGIGTCEHALVYRDEPRRQAGSGPLTR